MQQLKEREYTFKKAYENLIGLLDQKGFFSLQGNLVSTLDSNTTLSVQTVIARCPYNPDDFSQADSYVTLSPNHADAPRYRGAYFKDHIPTLTSGLNREQKEKARTSCLLL